MSISTQPNLAALKAEIIADINANTDSNATATQAAIAAKGFIKSIQRGEALADENATTAVTIAAVNTAKSVLIVNQGVAVVNVSNWNYTASAELTNSTTLTLKKSGTVAGYARVVWQVVEYE